MHVGFHQWDVSYSSSSVSASTLQFSSIGKQEADRPNVSPARGSDAVWRMSLPSASRLLRLKLVGLVILVGSLCSLLWMSFPRFIGGGGAGAGDFTFRVPPAWAPQNEHHYSFRAWGQVLQLWLMQTEVDSATLVASADCGGVTDTIKQRRSVFPHSSRCVRSPTLRVLPRAPKESPAGLTSGVVGTIR